MPAYFGIAPPAPDTLIAATDLFANRFVRLTGANQVSAITGITQQSIGVCMEDVVADEVDAASIWLHNRGGIVSLEAAAAISAGANVAPSANGRAQTAVSTQFVRGIALEAATDAGHIIPVLVHVLETAV